jgi:hypothetical protein
MKSNVQLRDELCDVFDRLTTGDIEPSAAKELVNTAGKIIASVKLELVYAALRKEIPMISFLDDGAIAIPHKEINETKRVLAKGGKA